MPAATGWAGNGVMRAGSVAEAAAWGLDPAVRWRSVTRAAADAAVIRFPQVIRMRSTWPPETASGRQLDGNAAGAAAFR